MRRLLWLLAVPLVAEAGTTWFPGDRTFGTMVFEDQWPCAGDRDFNDVALRYLVEKVDADDNGVVERMVVHLQPQGLGASLCNGIALRLPVPTTSISSATTSWGNVAGTTWSTPTAVEITNSGGQAVLWLTPDLRVACGGATGFVNTDPTKAVTGCATMELDVRFSANPGALDTEPFDLFLHRCTDRSRQIHRSGYAGTVEMNTSLFGTCNDGSTTGRWFVQSGPVAGLPFALVLGEGIDQEGDGRVSWPIEQAAVESAWPRISLFAGGQTTASDFYYVGTSPPYVYDDGLGGALPAPPKVHERGDGTAGHPAVDCRALHTDHPTLPTGKYWIKPQGTTFRAYCDMDTGPGGWTLCLNSRYTAAASALYTTTYAKVWPGPDNSGGYYDFCPQDADDYLMALADPVGSSWDLHDAVLHITESTPWNLSTSEWNDVGITATAFTWLELNASVPYPVSTHCSTPQISFWEFVHPGPRSLHGYKRGHFYCHLNNDVIFLMGAGCNYGGCGISGSTVQAPTYANSEQGPQGWAWRARASLFRGRHDTNYTAGPVQAERVQIYYR